MFLLPVVNSYHGLAALLGFNSDTNTYNYCYLFALVDYCKALLCVILLSVS